jgi:hypothetical protein
MDAYLSMVQARESGGSLTAKNPRSTATGPYQFLEGTWNELARQRPDLGLTPDGRTDPAQNERAIRAFTDQNARALSAKGIEATPANLYAAHFLGAGGATTVLTQPDNASLDGLLSPQVIAANPFLRGMTVADFRAWTAGKKGGGSAPVQTAQPTAPQAPQNALATQPEAPRMVDQRQDVTPFLRPQNALAQQPTIMPQRFNSLARFA